MNTSFYFLLLIFFNTNAEPLLRISQGILDGTVQLSRNGKRYSAFLGIPYAKPPIGNLRFKNPEPADSWIGQRSAKNIGNVCPQKASLPGNENCLFLNVYTPLLQFNSIDRNNLLPVMVFIHGGGFTSGTGGMYGAEYLLDKNIILVTINYRLGIFGFISTGDTVATGNYGMKDQVLSLKWVQQNILSFGGDSKRVTIFGQSAGAASVSFHTISRASTGLFSSYIVQSGSLLSSWAFQTRDRLATYVRQFARNVGCTSANSANLIECLRNVTVERLIRADSNVDIINQYAILNWTPTNEPESATAFLTDTPKNLVNQVKDLPFMTGTVSDDGLLVTRELYSNDLLLMWVRLTVNLRINYFANRYLEVNNSASFTREVNKFYFNGSTLLIQKDDFLRNLTRFISDGFFFYPQIRTLERITSRLRNTHYFYNFGYRGKLSATQIDGDTRNLGVSHADELIYLFPLTVGAIRVSHLNFTSNDNYISKVMVDLWTSFAINRRPVSSELRNRNLWLPYTTQNPVHIQIGNILNNTDPSISMSSSYFTQRMNFWRQNIPNM